MPHKSVTKSIRKLDLNGHSTVARGLRAILEAVKHEGRRNVIFGKSPEKALGRLLVAGGEVALSNVVAVLLKDKGSIRCEDCRAQIQYCRCASYD